MRKFLLFALTLFFLAACTTQPLLEFPNVKIESGKLHTFEGIAKHYHEGFGGVLLDDGSVIPVAGDWPAEYYGHRIRVTGAFFDDIPWPPVKQPDTVPAANTTDFLPDIYKNMHTSPGPGRALHLTKFALLPMGETQSPLRFPNYKFLPERILTFEGRVYGSGKGYADLALDSHGGALNDNVEINDREILDQAYGHRIRVTGVWEDDIPRTPTPTITPPAADSFEFPPEFYKSLHVQIGPRLFYIITLEILN